MNFSEASRVIDVLEEREKTYGPPVKNFTLIANLWSEWLGQKVTPQDVCVMMGMLKMARLKADPTFKDSWIDLMGYACIGEAIGEVK